MTVRLWSGVPAELRRLTRQVAAAADRNVNQSEAALAAIRYALEHVSDVAALLPGAGEAASPGEERGSG